MTSRDIMSELRRMAGKTSDLGELLIRLNACKDACPRLTLEACLHSFLLETTEGRRRILRRYLDSYAHPALEVLPMTEANRVREDLLRLYSDTSFE